MPSSMSTSKELSASDLGIFPCLVNPWSDCSAVSSTTPFPTWSSVFSRLIWTCDVIKILRSITYLWSVISSAIYNLPSFFVLFFDRFIHLTIVFSLFLGVLSDVTINLKHENFTMAPQDLCYFVQFSSVRRVFLCPHPSNAYSPGFSVSVGNLELSIKHGT